MKRGRPGQARSWLAALAVFAGLASLGRPAAAQSTPTASVQISVTPQVTRSVTVALESYSSAPVTAPYGLGALSMNALTTGATAYLVTNTGNIWETFTLQITSETDSGYPPYPWHSTDSTSASLQVADAYELFAQFSSSTTTTAPSFPAPGSASLLLVQRSQANSAGPLSGEYAGAASGMDVHAVPGENSVGLWFAIQTSQYTTTESQKNVVVTVAAQ